MLTSVLLAALIWGLGKTARRSNLAAALALATLSHIVLDIIHHEPNIRLLPLQWGPRLGLNLQGYPILDLFVELAFCIVCWAVFGRGKGLLAGIIVFNLINIPLMFPSANAFAPIIAHPFLLPTVILLQILATWLFVWWFGRHTVFLGEAVGAPPP